MAPRRRQANTGNVAIWIGTASLIAGGLAWAYYSMRDGSSTTRSQPGSTQPGPTNTPTSRANIASAGTARAPTGKGKRPVLTLVLRAGQYPPEQVLARLCSAYTLRLVVPHRPTKDDEGSAASNLRAIAIALGATVIPHETAEGVVHVCRALGGLVVVAVGEDALGTAAPPPLVDPLPLDRLVRDVKTFVRGVLVLQLGDSQTSAGAMKGVDILEPDTARGVTTVGPSGRSWDDLLDKLDA